MPLLLWACALAATRPALAHDLNSAYLSLREVEDGRFLVHFRASSSSLEEELAAPAVFPSSCRFAKPYLDCGTVGLVGTLEFPWLKGAETSLLIEIEWRAGQRLLRMLKGSAASLVVYGIPDHVGLARLKPIVLDYTRLGIEHILTGFDHLLFVIALALLVRKRRLLVASITAFTIAHSLTLACAVLGLLSLAAPPVEAAIALSIVLVCGECLRTKDSLAHRAPWLVAFAFGLLHGLGFASALLAVGLPDKHIPMALLFFNVGVEVGQLGVLGLMLALRLLLAPMRLSPRLGRALVYAMGATAAYWSIGRIVLVFIR